MPLLGCKPRGAYCSVDADAEYEEIKQAILRRFDISPETCRQRFRKIKLSIKLKPEEFALTRDG